MKTRSYLVCFACFLVLLACQNNSKTKAIDSTNSTQTIEEKERPANKIIDPEKESIWDLYKYLQQIKFEGFYKDSYGVKDGLLWGIVDKTNKTILDFKYSEYVSNTRSFALKNGKTFEFYIDQQKPINIKTLDKLIPYFIEGLYVGVVGSKSKVIKPDGAEVSTRLYDAIDFPENFKFFFGLSDGIWRAYGMDGKELAENHPSKSSLVLMNKKKVSLRKIDKFVLGMAVEELKGIISSSLDDQNPSEEQMCAMYTLGKEQTRLSFLTEKNKKGERIIERIYINSVGMKTRSGIGIGSSEKELNATYKDYLESNPNPYNPKTLDYYYVPKDKIDSNYRICFLVKNGFVETYSIGRLPAIQYKEGCF